MPLDALPFVQTTTARPTVRELRGNERYACIEFDAWEVWCIVVKDVCTSNDPDDSGVPMWSLCDVLFANEDGKRLKDRAAWLADASELYHDPIAALEDYLEEPENFDEIAALIVADDALSAWADVAKLETAA